MIYLLLCVIANGIIFLLFKLFSNIKVNTFHAIVINYWVCVITGSIFIGNLNYVIEIPGRPWVPAALILGIIFISTFYLMALTTQLLGISVASVAAKMSLVIPFLFSLLILKTGKAFDILNIIGIIASIIAIYFTSLKNSQTKQLAGLQYWLFPILIFICNGAIDSIINYTNFYLLEEHHSAIFPIVIFGTAGGIGSIVMIFRKSSLRITSIIAGTILGLVNYFSVYFVVKTLSALNNDGALVFPLISIGIVVLSTVLSVILFREHLNFKNRLGLLLGFLALFLISYQEIIAYFR